MSRLFLIIAFFALSSTSFLMDDFPLSVSPPNRRPLPDLTMVDRRTPVDLTNGIDIHEHNDTNEVDISSTRASEIFTTLITQMQETNQSTMSKYVLNHIEDSDENGNLLEHWYIGMSGDGTRLYSVTLKTTNLNDVENPVHSELIKFKCKYFLYADQTICIPEKCSLDSFVPVVTPSMKCAHNYRKSQNLITTIYESSHTTDKKDMGDGLYELTLECMKTKVETMIPNGSDVCYYEGFEPENITSLEQLEETLFDEGWKRLSDGTYKKKVIVEEKTAEVVVNEEQNKIDDLKN